MTVTDEMIAAARRVLHADVDPSGWVDDDEIRAALEAALSAAPPSDDYRRGMEEASKNLNFRIGYLEESMRQIARIENKMSGGDWEEIDEARAIADRAIRALGGSK